MAYAPRQIVVRAREAASLVVLALERGGLVARFLRSYALENNRPSVTAQPALYRDLLDTIQRESLLAMVAYMEALLPKRFAKLAESPARPRKAPRGKKTSHSGSGAPVSSAPAPHLDLFRREFFVALGEALSWGEEEFDSFCHDLELYLRLEKHSPAEGLRRTPANGPYEDRCALL